MKGKYKATKKKVLQQRCHNCVFSRANTITWAEDGNQGYCHRYPLKSRVNPDHWCGEYKTET